MGKTGRVILTSLFMFVTGLVVGSWLGWWSLVILLPLAWWLGERSTGNEGSGGV